MRYNDGEQNGPMPTDAKIINPRFCILVVLLVAVVIWFSHPESSLSNTGKHITAAQARKLAVRFMEIRTDSPGNVGVDRIKYENEEWRIGATRLPSGPGKLAIMTVDNWGNVTRFVPALE
ncbi:MAG: hypothetical protein ACO1QS_15255 [Verrucomicrobiota bacterium]